MNKMKQLEEKTCIRDRKKEIEFENYFVGLGKENKDIQENILKQLEDLYCFEDYNNE